MAGDARSFPAEPESFDLVCSVGAVSDIGQLAALARPGGLVLLGDGYWRRTPGDVYLAALGATIDDLLDWQATLAIGPPHGLTLVRALPSSVEQWDRYEATWAANGERYAARHPGEPGLVEFLGWIRNGRRRYTELGGRDTLGFALLLVPERPGIRDRCVTRNPATNVTPPQPSQPSPATIRTTRRRRHHDLQSRRRSTTRPPVTVP